MSKGSGGTRASSPRGAARPKDVTAKLQSILQQQAAEDRAAARANFYTAALNRQIISSPYSAAQSIATYEDSTIRDVAYEQINNGQFTKSQLRRLQTALTKESIKLENEAIRLGEIAESRKTPGAIARATRATRKFEGLDRIEGLIAKKLK